ncbi:hypothetical protein [Brevundimonas sp. A19_0]|uniref:hypothetical protein n=1 Tax=Brevundimonas sp. A19_0 TaxID=2821087 RepID=UPI001ADC4AF1|nr:hypothetical protein [Brevundimonas sp. A19_0]MBO9500670.1 hypothetical protein [Brevundimonas sp. A19_0]
MPDYACFNLCLRSEIPLPELSEIALVGSRDVVTVSCGPVKDIGTETLRHEGRITILNLPGIGRFRIEAGTSIVVDGAPDCSDRNLRLFLLGSALGVLVHQRGLLPLHANAVILAGRALAFTGPSGAGKSTLAAWFSDHGYPVLCDDVCVIGVEGGAPVAYRGLPRLKLWADAAEKRGQTLEALERVHDDLDKYQMPLPVEVNETPVPLAAVIRLKRAGEEDGTLTRVRGRSALQLLMSETYRRAVVGALGLQAEHFRNCIAVASGAAILEWARPWGHDVFDAEVEAMVDRLLRSGMGKKLA